MNTLHRALDAWNQSNSYIRQAKETSEEIYKEIYQRMATLWRAEHEMYEAEYWNEIRP